MKLKPSRRQSGMPLWSRSRKHLVALVSSGHVLILDLLVIDHAEKVPTEN